MKKILFLGIAIMLLVFDWAALDDITTGNEPDYFGEYAILVTGFVVLGLMIFAGKKRLINV